MTHMRIFWSVYCIVLGLILLLKLLFHWDLSAWSAALALLFLESGVFLLTNGFGLRKRRHASGGGTRAFYSGSIEMQAEDPSLCLLFSHADIDLAAPHPKLARINCAFSSVAIRVPEGCSVRTVCRSAISTVTAPHGSYKGFFERVMVIGDGLQTQMEVQCLFSDVRILD